MVYHPSADTDEHFFGKQEIIHWINNGNLDDFVFDPNSISSQAICVNKFEAHFREEEGTMEAMAGKI